MTNVINATTETFDNLIESGTVLIDLWAPWCGPCKLLSPLMDQLSIDRTDIKVVKVNVDNYPEIAKQLNVRGVPTLIVYHNGKYVKTSVGAISMMQVTNLLNNL